MHAAWSSVALLFVLSRLHTHIPRDRMLHIFIDNDYYYYYFVYAHMFYVAVKLCVHDHGIDGENRFAKRHVLTTWLAVKPPDSRRLHTCDERTYVRTTGFCD